MSHRSTQSWRDQAGCYHLRFSCRASGAIRIRWASLPAEAADRSLACFTAAVKCMSSEETVRSACPPLSLSLAGRSVFRRTAGPCCT
eukprot:768479-Hanusia_phi.AAC.8